MTALYDDLNPDWGQDAYEEALPGWEPWEPDEADEIQPGGCDYCGAPDIRDRPEPFGRKPCCDACFNLIIGGEADDPPFRCSRERAALSDQITSASFGLLGPEAS